MGRDRPRVSVASGLLAVVIGLALGAVVWLIVAAPLSVARHVDDICSTERAVRRRAWEWFSARAAPDRPTRAAEHLPSIAAALLVADDAALVEGCDHLAALGLFGWDELPGDLVLAHLAFLVDAGLVHEPWFIVEQIVTAPESADRVRLGAIERGLLARSAYLPPQVYDVLAIAPDWADGTPCGPAQTANPGDLTAFPCRAAARLDAALWLRRLAAMHCDDIDPDASDALLSGSLRDPDGGHVTAALLAERTRSRDEAAALGRVWLADLDDDRKQAGVLLLALTGAIAPLRNYHPGESKAWLRTLIAIAVGSAEATVETGAEAGAQASADGPSGKPAATGETGASTPTPREVGWRARYAGESGLLNPDVTLLRLCLGDRGAIDDLFDAAAADAAPLATDALLRRSLPAWVHELATIESNTQAVACVQARWLIGKRQTRFDPASHRFVEANP